MNRSFELENQKQFSKKIHELLDGKTLEELAEIIGVNPSTLSRWVSGLEFPNNNNIEKIITKFNLTPEELGFKVIPKRDVVILFSKRFKELLVENNLSQKEFIDKTGFHKSMVSSWYNGKSKPNDENLKIISDFFNVSHYYLEGISDVRNIDYEIINETLKMNEESINNLRQINNYNIYGKRTDEYTKKYFGFDYKDITNMINADREFFHMFYFEVSRLLEYYTNEKFNTDFESLFNEIELDLDSEELDCAELDGKKKIIFGTIPSQTVYKVDMKTISKSVLCKKIEEMFEEFVNKQIKYIQEKNNTKKQTTK